MSQLADLEQLLSKSLDAQGTDRSPLSFLKHYLLLVQGMKSPKDRPKVSLPPFTHHSLTSCSSHCRIAVSEGGQQLLQVGKPHIMLVH